MTLSAYEKAYQESPHADYLHAKRMEAYTRMAQEKMKDPNFSMTTLEFLEAFYPTETELIDLEKLRVEDNAKIYEEWAASGDTRDFRTYAMQEYGFGDIDDLSENKTR